jgi:hypothetical protein
MTLLASSIKTAITGTLIQTTSYGSVIQPTSLYNQGNHGHFVEFPGDKNGTVIEFKGETTFDIEQLSADLTQRTLIKTQATSAASRSVQSDPLTTVGVNENWVLGLNVGQKYGSTYNDMLQFVLYGKDGTMKIAHAQRTNTTESSSSYPAAVAYDPETGMACGIFTRGNDRYGYAKVWFASVKINISNGDASFDASGVKTSFSQIGSEPRT